MCLQYGVACLGGDVGISLGLTDIVSRVMLLKKINISHIQFCILSRATSVIHKITIKFNSHMQYIQRMNE